MQISRGFNASINGDSFNFYGARPYQTPQSIPSKTPEQALETAHDTPTLEADFLDEFLSPLYQDSESRFDPYGPSK